MFNNFEYYPNTAIGVEVKPNYDVVKDNATLYAEIKKFGISRLQLNS